MLAETPALDRSTALFGSLSKSDKRDWLCLLIGSATFTLFLPVLWFDYLNYDDPGYVTNNSHVASGLSARNFVWALTTLHSDISYWHPVTWLSHQLECQLFGLAPGPHHVTNVLVHCVAGVLLFLFLNHATRRVGCSALVAALFCVHPLHVESVAWIAERKDVLSGLFWMATLCAYSFYVEKRTANRYLLMSFLFSLGLMSKPSVVTLPFVLLLLDYWPLRRINAPLTPSRSPGDWERLPEGRARRGGSWADSRSAIVRLIVEKLPLFVLSFAASMITFEAQQQLGAITPVEELDRSSRIDTALIAYVLYLGKTLWPNHLAVIYTRAGSWPFGLVLLAGASLSAITYFACRYGRRYPYLLVGWLWFFGTLVPMIGFVQAGAQYMADRFTYIPHIGLFIMLVWGFADLARRLSVPKEIVATIAILVVCIAAIAMRRQLLFWKDSLTLFEHAARATHNNWMAHHNYGLALANAGRYEEADTQFVRSLQILPTTMAYKSRGELYLTMGNPGGAIQFFNRAIAYDPGEFEAHRRLALIYAACKEPAVRNAELALKHALFVCQSSLIADAKQFDVLAMAYSENGKFDDAVTTEQRACALANAAGEDERELRRRLELFKSKQPYRTDFGAKNHQAFAKQEPRPPELPIQ